MKDIILFVKSKFDMFLTYSQKVHYQTKDLIQSIP